MLAQASKLATELSGEVGHPDGSPDAGEARKEATRKGDTPQDLDAKLNGLQALVAETSNELDAADGSAVKEPPVPDEAAATPTEQQPSPGEYKVPNFMAELAQSEESKEPSSEVPGSPPGVSQTRPVQAEAKGETGEPPGHGQAHKPGVVGTGLIGVVGTPAPSPAKEHASTSIAPGSPAETTPPTPEAAGITHILHAAAARISPLALSVCDRAVHLLEQFDRPMGWLSGSVRRVLGWIAIATVGTSVLVYLFTLL